MKLDETILCKYALEFVAALKKNPEQNLFVLKKKLSKKFKISGTPKTASILAILPKRLKTKKITKLLSTRLTRTGSGVTPVAVMPKPYPCPGKCTYCPTGENAPKSYTGFEPATMRAIQNKYDAKKQVDMRLDQYAALGQPTQKCELILMGGTFLAIPKDYADSFVHNLYGAFNGKKSKTLIDAQKINETAEHRVIGMTVETRPDWCKKTHIRRMLDYGATRVELGVQTLDDKVLTRVKRGHDLAETIRATKDLKNSAFKVGYHFMPGLYSTHKKDVKMMKSLFTDERFCPDMLKIYPCLAMNGTELYKDYEKGKFKPISNEDAVMRIADAAEYFPPWVRIMRMQRDIPAPKIGAGVTAGNLHQLVDEELKKRGKKLRDIRSREIFYAFRDVKNPPKLNLELVHRTYNASGGVEHFISYEDREHDVLVGFIRLRIPDSHFVDGIDDSTALIRELHVYGSEVSIGSNAKDSQVQHTGIGKKLLKYAEQVAVDSGKTNMIIIAGIGTREYYRKFGYVQKYTFMAKLLT